MLKVLHAEFGHCLKCDYFLSEFQTFLYYLDYMCSVFFSVVVKSKFLGIDVAFLKPSIINVSG